MDSVFFITLAIIVITSIIVAIVKRNSIDACFKVFKNTYVYTYFGDKIYKGEFQPNATGLALQLTREECTDHISYVVYKAEYPAISHIIRKIEDLDEKQLQKRNKQFLKALKQANKSHNSRMFSNFGKIIRDSIIDVFNLVIGQITKKYAVASHISDNSKYVNQMNQELINSMNASYSVILERYVGNKVVVKRMTGEEWMRGILMEYTSDFILLFNIEMKDSDNKIPSDAIISRSIGVVRHLSV